MSPFNMSRLVLLHYHARSSGPPSLHVCFWLLLSKSYQFSCPPSLIPPLHSQEYCLYSILDTLQYLSTHKCDTPYDRIPLNYHHLTLTSIHLQIPPITSSIKLLASLCSCTSLSLKSTVSSASINEDICQFLPSEFKIMSHCL